MALCFFDVLVTFKILNRKVILSATYWNWQLTEHWRFLVLHLGQSEWRLDEGIHNDGICHIYKQKRNWHTWCPILTMGVNTASTILGLASWLFQVAIDWRHLSVRYKSLWWDKREKQGPSLMLMLSVNRAASMFHLVCQVLNLRLGSIDA
jgi:hypothetical protein